MGTGERGEGGGGRGEEWGQREGGDREGNPIVMKIYTHLIGILMIQISYCWWWRSIGHLVRHTATFRGTAIIWNWNLHIQRLWWHLSWCHVSDLYLQQRCTVGFQSMPISMVSVGSSNEGQLFGVSSNRCAQVSSKASSSYTSSCLLPCDQVHKKFRHIQVLNSARSVQWNFQQLLYNIISKTTNIHFWWAWCMLYGLHRLLLW